MSDPRKPLGVYDGEEFYAYTIHERVGEGKRTTYGIVYMNGIEEYVPEFEFVKIVNAVAKAFHDAQEEVERYATIDSILNAVVINDVHTYYRPPHIPREDVNGQWVSRDVMESVRNIAARQYTKMAQASTLAKPVESEPPKPSPRKVYLKTASDGLKRPKRINYPFEG